MPNTTDTKTVYKILSKAILSGVLLFTGLGIYGLQGNNFISEIEYMPYIFFAVASIDFLIYLKFKNKSEEN